MFWSCKFTNSAQPQQHETDQNINNKLYYRVNYKNLTAYLLLLSLPFYYWQSHLPHGSDDGLLCIQFACLVFQPRLKLGQDRSLDYVLAKRMARISAAEIIGIHNKLIKSQSSHKATHFRGQLFQLPDISRFFDFLFGGSLTALVLFPFNWNAAFFKNVSLAKSVSAMWFKDRPRFLHIITPHLSEIVNYFVIIINERLYLIQRRSNIAVKLTRNEHDYYHTFDWRPPKLSFSNGKKSLRGACDW